MIFVTLNYKEAQKRLIPNISVKQCNAHEYQIIYHSLKGIKNGWFFRETKNGNIQKGFE